MTVLFVFRNEVRSLGKAPDDRPLATIYTHMSGKHMRAVLTGKQRPISSADLQEAVGRVNGQRRDRGEESLTCAVINTHTVALIDDKDSHTPTRLLVKAKMLAVELGFRSQVVAPPR